MTREERDRFDKLAPRDLAITLRSLRRRLGRVEARANDPELAVVIGQAGPSGQRLDDLLAEAARGAALTVNALEHSLDSNQWVVPAEVFEPAGRTYVDERAIDLGAAIAAISDEADGAASRVEHASASELSRTVTVTGGAETTPLAIGQQTAREMIGALDQAIRHIEWLENRI